LRERQNRWPLALAKRSAPGKAFLVRTSEARVKKPELQIHINHNLGR
jgi:hypothetical protein